MLTSISDIGLHFTPGLLLMIDLLLLSPPWTITVLEAGGVGSVLACLYWFWTELCYQKNGWLVRFLDSRNSPPETPHVTDTNLEHNRYPYPLFAALDVPQRALVFAASGLTFTVSALCLRGLYVLVNGALRVEHYKKL